MNAPLDKRTITNMTSKGQVLIPKDVREQIGLVPGRPVEVGLNDRGEAVVLPHNPARGGAREERLQRLDRAIAEARRLHATGRPTDEIMRELRGDELLP